MTEFIIRVFYVLLICFFVAGNTFLREERENNKELPEGKRPKYVNYIFVYALPLFAVAFLAISGIFYSNRDDYTLLLTWFFGIITHVTVNYLAVMLLLPFLRKKYSARACAELWALPSLIFFAEYRIFNMQEPLAVFDVSGDFVKYAVFIWVTGSIIVVIKFIVSHFLFRRRIMKNAVLITDADIIGVWNEERQRGNFRKDFRLFHSTEVHTPLSIGLFNRTTAVILPMKEYTKEELSLIFRHELVHIGRQDSVTKFFMMCLSSFCWFNPLIWFAMKKSADDIELSCDETVLLDSDTDIRKKYAELILDTAAREKGFTTCLSASASALRYRLANIMKDRKPLNGGLMVGIILFVFMMSAGNIAFSFENITGEDAVFYEGTYSDTALTAVYEIAESKFEEYTCKDETALKKYLSELELSCITGNYSFSDTKVIVLSFYGESGLFNVTLKDHSVKVESLHKENAVSEEYYLASGIDWDYIYSLL